MPVFLTFLHRYEVVVSMYRSKLYYTQIAEKDKSTNGIHHYTNGDIRSISRLINDKKEEDTMG